jgi:hypothetical protein
VAELHVTNGDCAVEVLRKAGMQGDFLPWRDVLHEGPLADLPLEELSEKRAAFIAQCGWASPEEARRQFAERDARLRRASSDDEVVLWFEHDLYDQLQLIQVLAWFEKHSHPHLSLVCEPEYLGEMQPQRVAQLFAQRKPVTQRQRTLGAEAWRAFCRGRVESYLTRDLSALPFLEAALRRYLEEKPGADGLSRTERLALEALRGGPLAFADLFRSTQIQDEPRFLGDSVFMKRLERLEGKGLVERRGALWAVRQG